MQNIEQSVSLAPTKKAYITGQRKRLSLSAWKLICTIGDGILLFALFGIVILLAPHLNLALRVWSFEPGNWDTKLVWGILAFSAWSIAVKLTGAQATDSISGRLKGPFSAVLAIMLLVIFWIVFTYPFVADESVYIKVWLFFLALAIPMFSLWRVALAELNNLPGFRRQAVIVGVSSAGEAVARELLDAKRYTVNVLGYISGEANERLQSEDLPLLGDKYELRRMAYSGMVDIIIMATDYKANPDLLQEALELAQLDIEVVPMTMMYEHTSGKIPVEHAGDQWYVALPATIQLSPLYQCWRRVMDLAFGLFGTVVLLLIFPLLASLILLDSPGPIFYKQERLGRSGHKFHIYKFRSMHLDAEKQGKAVWAKERDPRITRIGRFMRSTHLDELPQVFNILRGEMSLIGPRPERQGFVAELEKFIPFYRCRLSVKPGLTGWAQVKFSYARTDQEAMEKLQYDLYYVKHQSFMLDVFILLKTVGEVLSRRGA